MAKEIKVKYSGYVIKGLPATENSINGFREQQQKQLSLQNIVSICKVLKTNQKQELNDLYTAISIATENKKSSSKLLQNSQVGRNIIIIIKYFSDVFNKKISALKLITFIMETRLITVNAIKDLIGS